MNYSRLALVVGLGCWLGSVEGWAYTFDSTLLDHNHQDIDLSVFEQGGQLPGVYEVDILLNGERVDMREVEFTTVKSADGNPTLAPCLRVAQLSEYGIRVEDYPTLSTTEDGCADISVIPQGRVALDFNTLALHLQIPQAVLRPRLQGVAPEALWHEGIPALLLNWQANTSRTKFDGAGQKHQITSSYVQLQPGINLGAWRFRHATTWQKSSNRSGQWQSLYTYAERGLSGLKSRLTLGERNTPSEVFDSVPFRGVMLNSDERMVPSGAYSYAPVVRGIAQTQARIEVTQGGYTLYDGLVAPGPFALTDLVPMGSNGDLHVTVHETDGSQQTFTVPYQTPAIALREGYLQYSAMAGQYRPADNAVDKTMVYQATAMYGLPWNLTAYLGGQLSSHYRAGTVGVGTTLGDWGALSFDATQSQGTRYRGATEKGWSWRVRYNKEVASTHTTFALASYQYASREYNTLSDILDTWQKGTSDERWQNARRQNRTSLTLSQALGDYGHLTLTGARDTFWERSGHQDSVSAGYSVALDDMTVSMNLSQSTQTTYRGHQRNDRVVSVWLSVPLTGWLGESSNVTYRWTTPSDGADTHEVGLNGRAFDRQLYWDVRQRYQPGVPADARDNSALRVAWSGGYGQLGGSYSYQRNVTQMGADASGGIVVHENGVTFGQPLGDTVALVSAPGVSGVSVGGWPGVKTDWRGYTTLGYVMPYQENTVTLNPADLSSEADILQTDLKVVPTYGAVIPANFETRLGGRVLMTLTRSDGRAVPYGAIATLETSQVRTGIVGDEGQVYLSGVPETGTMTVKWGQGQCRVAYDLPAEKGAGGLYTLHQVCQ
ncbi:fimbria/pilus outer membrane usher protein (plasmid) [Providencia rettgeri]|uniref:fimbria/pilus outer membrane usher protein n=1 Tax=Providencia rettgeri TaxID=587 RepID=UPI001CA60106|nr:fimbria/pilus outer membrane usher protein [Providencia rettgeri]QZY66599.1 fimbria/pilus outer membrane usher protein [Providencia rettgeri]